MATRVMPVLAPGALQVWRPLDGSVSVRFSTAVLEWVDLRAREAYGSVPRRGAETGGILIGRITVEAGGTSVQVDSAQAIDCERRFGPSFQLSGRDRTALDAQIARLYDQQLTPVGLFRTYTGGEADDPLGPDEPDCELMGSCLPESPTLFIALRPLGVSRVLANAHLCRDKGSVCETGIVSFPFSGPPFDLESESAATPGDEPALSAGAGFVSRRWLWPLAVALVGAGATVAGSVAYMTARRASPPVPLGLGLSVKTDPGQVTVHWNPALPAFREAAAGTLTITDEGRETRLWLDAERLRTGTATYAPQGRDLRIVLETTVGPHAGTREGAVVLNSPQAPAPVMVASDDKPAVKRKFRGRAARRGTASRVKPRRLRRAPAQLRRPVALASAFAGKHPDTQKRLQ